MLATTPSAFALLVQLLAATTQFADVRPLILRIFAWANWW